MDISDIRPIAPKRALEQRIEHLRSRGVLSLSESVEDELRPLASKTGALERFLDERHG